MTFAEQFGRNVAAARKRTGMSQETLSYRAQIHRTAIGKFERGEALPRADTLARLAGGLGVDPGEFFTGLAWEPGEWSAGRFPV